MDSQEPKFLSLDGEVFERYFKCIGFSFDALCRVHEDKLVDVEHRGQQNHPEQVVLRTYMDLFHSTLTALRMLHLYDQEKFSISAESGFPHFQLIEKSASWLRLAHEQGPPARSQARIKREMINHLFEGREVPMDLRTEMATRVAFDLYERSAFHRFNAGNVVSAGNGTYYYYWACYDRITSRPYVHLMQFEVSHDSEISIEDLEEEILKIIREEGAYAPKLSTVAGNIDRKLPFVHPKVLKRIGIGPFYFDGFGEHLPDEMETLFSFGKRERRFTLFVDHEYLISKRQTQAKGGLFKSGQTREVFVVPEQETDLYDRGVSGLTSSMVLPYRLKQHAEGLTADRLLCVDPKGETHVISQR